MQLFEYLYQYNVLIVKTISFMIQSIMQYIRNRSLIYEIQIYNQWPKLISTAKNVYTLGHNCHISVSIFKEVLNETRDGFYLNFLFSFVQLIMLFPF